MYEVQKGRQCEEVIKLQAEEIQKGIDVEVKLTETLGKANEEIAWLYQANDHLEKTTHEWDARFNNQVEMTKHQRTQKNKWKVGTIAAITFIVLREIFSPN